MKDERLRLMAELESVDARIAEVLENLKKSKSKYFPPPITAKLYALKWKRAKIFDDLMRCELNGGDL